MVMELACEEVEEADTDPLRGMEKWEGGGGGEQVAGTLNARAGGWWRSVPPMPDLASQTPDTPPRSLFAVPAPPNHPPIPTLHIIYRIASSPLRRHPRHPSSLSDRVSP
jgi:hypothetical protein